jgi:hypothetical protein
MSKLIPQEVVERRAKCDICGYELTVAEFLISGCYCVFHEKDENKLKQLKGLSKISYIRLLLGDLDIARGKIALKARGLDHVDYMANVGEVEEEIQYMDVRGMKSLVSYMRAHGR